MQISSLINFQCQGPRRQGGRLLFEGAINRGKAIIRGNVVYK